MSLNLDSSPLFKTICLIIFEIIPGIFLTINVAAYPEGLENSIGQEKWWFHLLVLLFYLLTIFIMIFVEGEQMEDIVDSKGAKIGVKGGRMGLTILSVFLACYVFTCLGYLISLIF